MTDFLNGSSGTSNLVFSAFDISAGVGYTIDLGVDLNTILSPDNATTGANTTQANTTLLSTGVIYDGVLTDFNNFLNVNNLSNTSSVQWNVAAADSNGRARVLITQGDDPSSTLAVKNGNITTIANNYLSYMNDVALKATTNNTGNYVETTTADNAAYSGGATWNNTAGSVLIDDTQTLTNGSSASLFLLSQSGTTGSKAGAAAFSTQVTDSSGNAFTATVYQDNTGVWKLKLQAVATTPVTNEITAVSDTNTVFEDQTVTGNVSTNDSETVTSAVMSYTLNNSVTGLTLATDGSYSFDASSYDSLGAGVTQNLIATYTVADASGVSSVATLTITVTGVNDAPVLDTTLIRGVTINEDATPIAVPGSYFAQGFLSSDPTATLINGANFDADGNAIGVAISGLSGITTGTVEISTDGGTTWNVMTTPVSESSALLLSATDLLKYTPLPNVNGIRTITFHAWDGTGGYTSGTYVNLTALGTGGSTPFSVETATHALNIDAVNDAPVAQVDSANLSKNGVAVATGNLVANDNDVDGDTLTVSAINADSGAVGTNYAGTYGTLTVSSTGQYSYSLDTNNASVQALNTNSSLQETFTYTINDGNGGTATSILTINIGGSNSAPVAVADVASATENGAIVTGNVAGNDSDIDSTSLTYSLSNSIAGLTLATDGKYSFNPSTGFDSLASGATQNLIATYSVTDDQGASSVTTLTITVTGVNDAPVSVADTANATENGSIVTGNVGNNDNDVDSANLTFSLNNTIAGLTLNANGQYSFDASSGYDTLAGGATQNLIATYTVTDSLGASSVNTFTITVTGVNDAPVAGVDSVSAIENGGIVTGSVNTNDTDADSAQLTFSLNNSIAGLSIATDGSYSFDANSYNSLAAGATQDLVATYTVSDNQGAVSVTTLTITVTGVNDAPVASSDVDGVTQGAEITGSVGSNDSDVDSGAALSYSLNNTVAGLTLETDGSYSFDAAGFANLGAGATQDLVATYTVTDDQGASSVATLTITVTGVNDAPVANADVIKDTTTTIGSTLNYDLTTVFVDADLETLGYNAVVNDQPVDWITFDETSGKLIATPTEAGTYVVTLTATDSADVTASDVFTITVQEGGAGGKDKLTGDEGDNNLFGGEGNDKLTGLDGNDTLDGGTGVDALDGGNGDDTYLMDFNVKNAGKATASVSLQDSIKEAKGEGSGDDTIILRGEAELAKASTIVLAANLENLDASQTVETLLNLKGNTSDNIITGNDANNQIDGDKGNDSLIGGIGDDTLIGGAGEDNLQGGAGNDTYVVELSLNGSNTTFEDTITEALDEGNDTVMFTGNLKITGDNIEISLDDDHFTNFENLDISGTGKSKLNISGNSENNLLVGNAASNQLDGGVGDDTLVGGAGADSMLGGEGSDSYYVDSKTDVITENEDEGIDTVYSSSSSYTLADNVENLVIVANTTGTATGNALDNDMMGSNKNNTLTGMEGDDTLNGGLGKDNLVGGAGNDVFVFDTALKGNVDTIKDFVSGEDQIHLDLQIFTKLSLDGIAEDHFVSSTKDMVDNSAYIIFDSKTGKLSYDENGIDKGSAVQFATIGKVDKVMPELTASDFVIFDSLV